MLFGKACPSRYSAEELDGRAKVANASEGLPFLFPFRDD